MTDVRFQELSNGLGSPSQKCMVLLCTINLVLHLQPCKLFRATASSPQAVNQGGCEAVQGAIPDKSVLTFESIVIYFLLISIHAATNNRVGNPALQLYNLRFLPHTLGVKSTGEKTICKKLSALHKICTSIRVSIAPTSFVAF